MVETRPASGCAQLRAVLRKNARLKRRGWCTTCCEILSPALFCSILVLGYTLSDEVLFNASMYASLKFDLVPLLEVSALGARRVALPAVMA